MVLPFFVSPKLFFCLIRVKNYWAFHYRYQTNDKRKWILWQLVAISCGCVVILFDSWRYFRLSEKHWFRGYRSSPLLFSKNIINRSVAPDIWPAKTRIINMLNYSTLTRFIPLLALAERNSLGEKFDTSSTRPNVSLASSRVIRIVYHF